MRGSALTDVTFQSQNVITTLDAKSRNTYQFALPPFRNISSSPVTVVSVHIKTVSSAITVLGYRKYRATRESGMPLNLRSDIPATAPLPKAYNGPIVVESNHTSPYFYMVEVELRKPSPGKLAGCVVEYSQSGVLYQQNLSCQFRLVP